MNTLLYEAKGPVGIVTLNRPDTLNAVSPEVYLELRDLFTKLDADPAVRAIIITGAGKVFCAGADIEAMSTMTPYEARTFATQGLEAFRAIAACSKPVIAAVNGLALGGGYEMVLACDLVVASEKARFGFPEINLGIFPGNGGTQRFIRIVGAAKAKEFILTAKTFKPDEALALNLVNTVVAPEELLNAAMSLAEGLCARAPITVTLAKAAINQALELQLDAGLKYEVECWSSLFATADQTEGMVAFLEKRDAVFNGN